MKKDGELMMTAKAYNGRVVLEWLHDALRRAQGSVSDCRFPLVLLLMPPSGISSDPFLVQLLSGV